MAFSNSRDAKCATVVSVIVTTNPPPVSGRVDVEIVRPDFNCRSDEIRNADAQLLFDVVAHLQRKFALVVGPRKVFGTGDPQRRSSGH